MEPRYSNVSCNNDVEDDNSHSTRRNCNKKGGRVNLENTWNEVLGNPNTPQPHTASLFSFLASHELINKRVAQIRNLIEDAKEDYGKEKLNERIARFSGEVAVIQFEPCMDEYVASTRSQPTIEFVPLLESYSLDLGFLPKDARIISSSNQGILLLETPHPNIWYKKVLYYVCKPATKQILRLPDPYNYRPKLVAIIVMSSNPILHYKIVRFYEHESLCDIFKFDAYSQTWKTLSLPDPVYDIRADTSKKKLVKLEGKLGFACKQTDDYGLWDMWFLRTDESWEPTHALSKTEDIRGRPLKSLNDSDTIVTLDHITFFCQRFKGYDNKLCVTLSHPSYEAFSFQSDYKQVGLKDVVMIRDCNDKDYESDTSTEDDIHIESPLHPQPQPFGSHGEECEPVELKWSSVAVRESSTTKAFISASEAAYVTGIAVVLCFGDFPVYCASVQNEDVTLEETTVELDEGQAGSDPGKTPESRPPLERVLMEEDQSGSNPRQSHVVQAGPNPEPMHEDFVAIVYPQVHESLKLTSEEKVYIENPRSSFGCKANVENEVESMVTVPIHQASSSSPPLSTPIIDLTPPKPVSPPTQEPIFTATTTTLPLLPPPPQ
ncbi:histone deacetylase 14 [Tanacetum coccineum]